MRPQLRKEFDYIVDVITCGDGGVEFVKFIALVNEMDKRAENGDAYAAEVLRVITAFYRLISIAQWSKEEVASFTKET